jgi:hypothetical protein
MILLSSRRKSTLRLHRTYVILSDDDIYTEREKQRVMVLVYHISRFVELKQWNNPPMRPNESLTV